MKKYHIHIYFEPTLLESAKQLKTEAVQSGLFEIVKLYENPIGPHPTGMIEIHFQELDYKNSYSWVEAHRRDFSVLIHEDTGDDFKDHTEGSVWLGKKKTLNFDFFKEIQSRPELRIHNLKVV